MKFVTIRDLRGNTARLRRDLREDREIVLTANGRPFALMTPVEPDTVEEELLAIRRARAGCSEPHPGQGAGRRPRQHERGRR
jgi:antitoxin (DNA-binding transcriptional repressor) of toxin-antitoxin stability system